MDGFEKRHRASRPESPVSFICLPSLTAAFAEGFVRGRLLYAAGLIPVACFVVVTLLLYQLFRPVNRSLASLAAISNLIGLTLRLSNCISGARMSH